MATIKLDGKKVVLSFAVMPHTEPERFNRMWSMARETFPDVALTNYIGSDSSGNAYFQVWGDSTPYILDGTKF